MAINVREVIFICCMIQSYISASEINVTTVDEVYDNILLSDIGIFANTTTELKFRVKGCRDSYLILLSKPKTTSLPFYKIIIGGWHNNKSRITKESDKWIIGDVLIGLGVMDCHNFKEFWVSWKNGKIQVGRGSILNTDELLSYTDPCPFSVQDINISTGNGQTVEWIITLPNESVIGKLNTQSATFVLYHRCPTFEVIHTTYGLLNRGCLSYCLTTNGCYGVRYDAIIGRCDLTSNIAISTELEDYFRRQP